MPVRTGLCESEIIIVLVDCCCGARLRCLRDLVLSEVNQINLTKIFERSFSSSFLMLDFFGLLRPLANLCWAFNAICMDFSFAICMVFLLSSLRDLANVGFPYWVLRSFDRPGQPALSFVVHRPATSGCVRVLSLL